MISVSCHLSCFIHIKTCQSVAGNFSKVLIYFLADFWNLVPLCAVVLKKLEKKMKDGNGFLSTSFTFLSLPVSLFLFPVKTWGIGTSKGVEFQKISQFLKRKCYNNWHKWMTIRSYGKQMRIWPIKGWETDPKFWGLTHDMAMIQALFTSSKWNMDETLPFFSLKMIVKSGLEKIFLKLLHSEAIFF